MTEGRADASTSHQGEEDKEEEFVYLSEERSREQDIPHLVPPDGGWGWIILAGNFLLGFLIQSIPVCFGLIYLTLVTEGETNTKASVVIAIYSCVFHLLGPLMTSLSQIHGHRTLSLLGVVILVTALLLCSVSTQIEWLYFTFGIVAGTGASLAYSQTFLIGQKYFYHKRVAANGITHAGVAIGNMTMPPLFLCLIEYFTLKGAFILWAGVILHSAIGAMLYQPVEWHMKVNPKYLNKYGDMEPKLRGSFDSSLANASKENVTMTAVYIKDNTFSGTKKLPIYCVTTPREKSNCVLLKNCNKRFCLIENEKEFYQQIRRCPSQITGKHDLSDKLSNSRHSPSKSSSSKDSENLLIYSYFKCPKFSNVLSFKLLKNPYFLITSSAGIINRQVHFNLITYLPKMASLIEASMSPSFFLSITATSSLASMLIYSYISSRLSLQSRYAYIAATLNDSVAILGLAFSWDFWSLTTFCVWYGIGIGVCGAVGPVLLVEYLGIEILPQSYGLTLFILGLIGLISFPFTGWINDLSGGYRSTYCILSVMSLFPAILWSFAPLAIERQTRKGRNADLRTN